MKKAHYNIAIDGPSGAGKSTVAKLLSAKLGIVYLDTGAMYRAAALYALRKGIDPNDSAAAESVMSSLDLEIRYEGGSQKVFLFGEDVSSAIRQNEISKAASDISRHIKVRQKMVALQQQIAAKQSSVLDGRDICTYVLPGAKYKFFLTASAEIRAKRRTDELIGRGEKAEYATILKEIEQRDYNDSHREFAPLKQAPDAILIDSGGLDIDGVLDLMLKYIGEAK